MLFLIQSLLEGDAPPDVATDTHDGWWAKQWRKKKKKPDQPIEIQIEALVEEVIAKAKKAPNIVPFSAPSTAGARAALLERVLLQIIQDERDEDERDIEMLLL
jgi:hypothetical protein